MINSKDIFNTGGYDGETNLKDILKFNIAEKEKVVMEWWEE